MIRVRLKLKYSIKTDSNKSKPSQNKMNSIGFQFHMFLVQNLSLPKMLLKLLLLHISFYLHDWLFLLVFVVNLLLFILFLGNHLLPTKISNYLYRKLGNIREKICKIWHSSMTKIILFESQIRSIVYCTNYEKDMTSNSEDCQKLWQNKDDCLKGNADHKYLKTCISSLKDKFL